MSKKLLSVFVAICLVLVPTLVKAQEVESLEGQIVPVEKDQKVPFSGLLLDTAAAVKITTDKKYSLLEGELKLDYELKKQAAEFQLKLDSLQVSYDSLKEKTGSIITIKNDEITRMQELIKEDPNDYTSWWFAGGFAIGVLVSIGIFFAAVEVSN
jgi:hypothetical protein